MGDSEDGRGVGRTVGSADRGGRGGDANCRGVINQY
jgi:hypothetical protein